MHTRREAAACACGAQPCQPEIDQPVSFFRQSTDSIEDILYAAESSLTDPEVRKTRARVELLLHPEFSETGSSGDVYDRDTMIDMMTTEAPGEVLIRDFEAQRLSEDVAVVKYRSVGLTGQETRRTSVWVNQGGSWRLRHHQGTRVPDRWNHRD
jgi:ribonuclease HI